MSLARRHIERTLAAAATGAALTAAFTAPAMAEGTQSAVQYNALKAVLDENLRQLKDIASHDARAPKKAEFAKTFDAWVEGALAHDPATGPAPQDDILVTMTIWAIDTGDIARALELGRHVLANGLVLPAPYKRTPACLIAEEVGEKALAGTIEPTALELAAVDHLTAEFDMPDAARAKLKKAFGLSMAKLVEDAGDPENAVAGIQAARVAMALDALTLAQRLDKKAGVKKQIEALDRKLTALGGRPAPDEDDKKDDDDNE